MVRLIFCIVFFLLLCGCATDEKGDICEEKDNPCDDNGDQSATCSLTETHYVCACSEGFSFDGVSCKRLFPNARSRHAMAYDNNRLRLVMMGGGTGYSIYYGDTWEWEGNMNLWFSFAPGVAPSERSRPAMVFDKKRGKAVLYGGGNASKKYMSDTWEWDGANWAERTMSGGNPPARHAHAMAYDEANERTILFGGIVCGSDDCTYYSDTWAWDGETWTHMACNTPGSRDFHAMAYDSARGRIVLFGGREDGKYDRDETWEWTGSDWVSVSTGTTPAARRYHAMAFDSNRQRTVLFGGANEDSDELNETWEWDGASWIKMNPDQSPLPRVGHAMVYDDTRKRVLLFGGYSDDTNTLLGDFWEWDGTNWAEIK